MRLPARAVVARTPAAAAVCLVTVTAAPAAAITDGVADGTGHPAVGALVQAAPYSDGTYAYCRGTLISPTVFLTAAHCGHPGQTSRPGLLASRSTASSPVYVGAHHADPRYDQARSDPHDIAAVVFAKPIKGITPMRLPTAGLLDQSAAAGALVDQERLQRRPASPGRRGSCRRAAGRSR